MSTRTPHRPNPVGQPVGRAASPNADWSAAAALAVAGVLFIAYPALRPYTDETTLDGAAAMASSAWVASHTFGMAAFAALAIGLQWLLGSSASGGSVDVPRSRGSRRVPTMAWLGTLLILPYYGAETFGLRAIGARALAAADAAMLVEMAETVRYDLTAMVLFGAGLIALAVAGVSLAVTLRRGGGAQRWGGLLAGTGLALYLPQFFGPPGVRIGHGLVLGAGCLILAATTARSRTPAIIHDHA